MVMIPNGTCDVIKTLNVNISSLRGAIEIVDPSLERALDIESDYECLMVVQLSFNYLISKGQIFSPLWRHRAKTFVTFADVNIKFLTFVGISFFFAMRTERRNVWVQERAQPFSYWYSSYEDVHEKTISISKSCRTFSRGWSEKWMPNTFFLLSLQLTLLRTGFWTSSDMLENKGLIAV